MTQEIIFARGLIEIKCLYYYDGPLLSHFRDVSRIVIDGGETFDGSVQQFQDSFFSNVHGETIAAWCKPQGMEFTIEGQDYIMMWTDLDDQQDYWFAVQITPEDLKLYLTDGITTLQVLERSSAIYSCKGQFIGEDLSGTGTLIQFTDIPDDQRPTVDSWLHLDKYHTDAKENELATFGDSEGGTPD